jgi:hypothetical protein
MRRARRALGTNKMQQQQAATNGVAAAAWQAASRRTEELAAESESLQDTGQARQGAAPSVQRERRRRAGGPHRPAPRGAAARLLPPCRQAYCGQLARPGGRAAPQEALVAEACGQRHQGLAAAEPRSASAAGCEERSSGANRGSAADGSKGHAGLNPRRQRCAPQPWCLV